MAKAVYTAVPHAAKVPYPPGGHAAIFVIPKGPWLQELHVSSEQTYLCKSVFLFVMCHVPHVFKGAMPSALTHEWCRHSGRRQRLLGFEAVEGGEQSDSDSWEGKERKCSKVEVSAKLQKGLDLSGKDLKKALHILRKGN